MHGFSKVIALTVLEILYWFFPNLFSMFSPFQLSNFIAIVIIGSATLGFLAGKNLLILKEETIEKNVNLVIWALLIYFFVSGFVIAIFSLNLFPQGTFTSDFPIFEFLPLLLIVFILGIPGFCSKYLMELTCYS